MRRAAEQAHVTGLTQLGIRNVSSTTREGYEAARAMGADILSVRQVRKLGTEAVLARIPKDARLYITLDIDGFCPTIAPGTGTPSHGGFLYYEVLELLQVAARALRSWASTWWRWRRIMTRPARPRPSRRRCC